MAAAPQAIAVTNAADYSPTLSPGSIAALFGTGLAPSKAAPNALPLPTLLNTVTVTVNGKAAPLFYVSDGQIDFQIPFETSPGTANLQVNVGGALSSNLPFIVARASLGIFQAGGGFAVVQNSDLSPNSPSNPAAVGSVVTVYVTGIGPLDAAVMDGEGAPGAPPAKYQGAASALIGDVDAPIQFIGMTPGSVGLAQVNVVIPDLPSGTYPMWFSLNGIQSVSGFIAVKGAGTVFPYTNLLSLVSAFSLPGVGPTKVPGISGVVANSAAWFNNTLYVCSPSDIKVVDVTHPEAPVFLERLDDAQLAGSGHNCTINSGVAKPFLVDLVRASQSIILYDLSAPQNPVKIKLHGLPLVPRGVSYDGNASFFSEDLFTPSGNQVVRTSGKMVSVDLSNPQNPVTGALLKPDSAHPETNTTNLKPYMIVPRPGLLYVASTTASETFDNGTAALDIFDTTTPANIHGIGQILITGPKMLLALAIEGNELIALGDTRGFSPGNASILDFPYMGNMTITMFDITDPRNPVMQGNIIVDSMQPGNVGGPISLGALSMGGGFFIATCAAPDLQATGGGGNNSLVLIDARDPQHPVAHTYATISGLGGLTIANGYLYAAAGSGANVFKITLPAK
jgi:uncharacterized protein (TIGR03437 family)